jgi:hypothetical protein
MGIMQTLFGGSSEKSKSYNLNNQMLTNSLGGSLGAVGDSYGLMKALLSGDMSGFNQFKQNAGYDVAAQQGSQGIMANAAARGLLRSGAARKGLVRFGQGLSNQYLNDYFQRLTGMGQLGLGSAGILANSGQESTKEGSSTKGMGGFLGGIFSGIAASDPRLKENVVQIGVLEDGLPLYSYNYIWDDEDTRQIGVMADEVAELRPWAVGPQIGDYMTVDYGKLGNK